MLLCLYFIRPAFAWFNGQGGGHDWDAQTFYLEAAVRPVLDHGRRPVWNPWYGGGLPQAANPQVKLYTPTWFFALAFGSLAAHKIAVIFYYLLGAWSMVFLLRSVLRLRPWAALAGTVVYVFAGSIPLRVIAGHSTFLCILIYPLVIALFLLCLRARGTGAVLYGFAAAMVLSVMYGEGYPSVMLFLPGAGFALLAFSLARRDARLLLRGGLVLIMFAVLAAHRLVPQIEYMAGPGAFRFPDLSSLSPDALRAIFLDAVSDPAARKWVGQKYLWWEYGTYIGAVPVLSAAALLVFTRRRHLPLIATLVFILALTMGPFAFWSPATQLSRLPLYENLRAWARFSMPALMCGAVLYALLLHRGLVLAQRYRFARRAAPFLAAILVLWSFYDLNIINGRKLKNVFTLSIPGGAPSPRLETIARLPSYGSGSAMLPAMRRNLSTRDAYEMLKSNRSAVARGEENYRGEFFLKAMGRAITPRREYPDRLEFDFILKQGDTLVLNRNWSPHARVTTGQLPSNENGLIGVELAPGRHRFAVYHGDGWTAWLLYLSAALHGLLLILTGITLRARRT